MKSDTGSVLTTGSAPITVTLVNDVPTVSDFSESGTEDTTVTFTATDFTDEFSDGDSDSLVKIQITALPDAAQGELKLFDSVNNVDVAVTLDQEITYAQIQHLKFVPVADYNGSASFEWKLSLIHI